MSPPRVKTRSHNVISHTKLSEKSTTTKTKLKSTIISSMSSSTVLNTSSKGNASSSSLSMGTSKMQSTSTPTHSTTATLTEPGNIITSLTASRTLQEHLAAVSSNDNTIVNNIDLRNLLTHVIKEFSDVIERMKADFQKQITEFHVLINQLISNNISNDNTSCNIQTDVNNSYEQLESRLD